MKHQKQTSKEPLDPLAPGTPVRLKDGDYANSRGHVVVCHDGQAVQVHIDSGDGAGHEIVTARSRLIALDPQKAHSA